MSKKIEFLNINHDHIHEYECPTVVTSENVCIGRPVSRGKHWSSQWSENVHGVIIGYTDMNGDLHGENVYGCYNQVQQQMSNWCVIEQLDGKRSVYPIGFDGIYALGYVN